MFPAENLRDWRGHKVIDPQGDRIGDLAAVYVDTATDEPSFATVRVGMTLEDGPGGARDGEDGRVDGADRAARASDQARTEPPSTVTIVPVAYG
jgi:PRC-barrel domain protein